MTRAVLLLLSLTLLGAAGAGWHLVTQDRRSPRALDRVELDATLPAPTWQLLAGAGLLLLGLSARSRPAPAAPSRRPAPRRPAAQDTAAPMETGPPREHWYRDAVSRSSQAGWEHGVSVAWAPLPEVDVMLVLQGATPARLRRSVKAFAAFLGPLPRPRRVRVQLRQCDTDGLALAPEVEGAFHAIWSRGQVRVLRSGDDVDVFFQRPEEGWPSTSGTTQP